MIEGDIKAYFDILRDYHKLLAQLLCKEIRDQNLIDMYWKLVKAGAVLTPGALVESNIGVPLRQR